MKHFMRMLLSIGIGLASWSASAFAQEAWTEPLRLERAVELAKANYPAIRAARAQAGAAEAGVEIARNAYLPRTEIDWQQTRGTRNNIFGQFFPQAAIPPISGPVFGESSFRDSAWGSGGGLLFSWEPFDFGLRRANVKLADRVSDEAKARAALTEFDVAIAAADAFLRAIASEQAVRAAQANVERMETFAKAVRVLVENELRPGADASRAEAELAAARNTLIQTRQQAALARVALTEAIGMAGQSIVLDAGNVLDGAPPSLLEVSAGFTAHPLMLAQKASLDTVVARRHVLDRSFFPRFNWQTAVFGRGTGARVDGRLLDNRGFFPDTPNWATGLTISFAPTDIFNLRARRKQEENYLAAEQARHDEALQRLKAEEARARALAESAREYAENAPRQLEAARETELRVRKRYEAELSTVTEVAEAQRLLTQAEVDQALARLALWRARLAEARARGDLAPFLDQLQGRTK